MENQTKKGRFKVAALGAALAMVLVAVGLGDIVEAGNPPYSTKYGLVEGFNPASPTFTGVTSFGGALTVAGAGTTTSDATVLSSQFNVITTGSANSGVKLPTAANFGPIYVSNRTGANILLYPPTGSTLNASSLSLAANSPITMPSTAGDVWYVAFPHASTAWSVAALPILAGQTVPGLYSRSGLRTQNLYIDVTGIGGGQIIYGTSTASNAYMQIGQSTTSGWEFGTITSTTASPAFLFNARVTGSGDLFRWQKTGTTVAGINTSGQLYHSPPLSTQTETYTVVPADFGGTILDGTDNAVITLPLAATYPGATIRVQNSATAGNTAFICISPNASDKIVGTVMAVSSGGVTNKDWCNTKLTHLPGDYTHLQSDGGTTWRIIGGVGVWASEP